MTTVKCAKCKSDRDSPQDLPYVGKIGELISNNVCGICWAEWEEMQMKVMNEYKIDLSEGEHRTFMMNKMKEFLNLTS